MRFRYDKESEELVVSAATKIEYHQMDIWLTRKVKGYRFNPRVKMGIWDGSISYFKNGRVNLGLWKECLRGCQEIGSSFIIENKEDFPINREVSLEDVKDFCGTFFHNHQVKDKKTGEWINFRPKDYQIETAFKILRNRYALGEVATSGGKSLIIAIVFFFLLKSNPNSKFLIITPSISLVTQFYDNIMEYYYGENNLSKDGFEKSGDIKIEEIMSESPRKYNDSDANIYIGTYQSLEKRNKEWFSMFNAVACDEAHMAKARSLISILSKTFKSAEYRFGVSGTFPDEDGCEILAIQSVLGPKISQIEASMLVERGDITPMQIKALMLNHNEVAINSKLRSARNPNNGREIYEFEKKFIQASDKRIDFIKKLVSKKCTGNTLVLFHTIDYGKKIFDTISKIDDFDSFYIDGEVSGKNRQEIFSQMATADRRKVLVASFGTLSTGISINSIQSVVFCDSFKSENLIIQSIGRSLRKFDGKDIATIWDLVDILDATQMNNVFCKQFEERERFYKKRKYPYEKINITL